MSVIKRFRNGLIVSSESINQCIVVIDSGIGGLSVLKYLSIKIPDYDFVFYRDSENFPYGDKCQSELNTIGEKIIEKVKLYKPCAIVIACNSLSCSLIKKDYGIPIIRMNEAILAEAKKETINKAMLVICTEITKKTSFYQNRLVDKNCYVKALPELVTLIEKNKCTMLDISTQMQNINLIFDVLILGCTHFNIIRSQLDLLYDGDVKIVDGLEEVYRKTMTIISNR